MKTKIEALRFNTKPSHVIQLTNSVQVPVNNLVKVKTLTQDGKTTFKSVEDLKVNDSVLMSWNLNFCETKIEIKRKISGKRHKPDYQKIQSFFNSLPSTSFNTKNLCDTCFSNDLDKTKDFLSVLRTKGLIFCVEANHYKINKERLLEYLETAFSRFQRFQFPKFITKDVAFILGAVASRGHFSPVQDTGDKTYYQYGYISISQELSNYKYTLYSVMENVFGMAPKVYSSNKSVRFTYTIKDFYHFLNAVGLEHSSINKIPDCVFRLATPELRAFIQSLFSISGKTSDNKYILVGKIQFLQKVQLLLMKLGLFSYIVKQNRKYKDDIPHGILHVNRIDSVRLGNLIYGTNNQAIILPNTLPECYRIPGTSISIDSSINYIMQESGYEVNDVNFHELLDNNYRIAKVESITRFKGEIPPPLIEDCGSGNFLINGLVCEV